MFKCYRSGGQHTVVKKGLIFLSKDASMISTRAGPDGMMMVMMMSSRIGARRGLINYDDDVNHHGDDHDHEGFPKKCRSIILDAPLQ